VNEFRTHPAVQAIQDLLDQQGISQSELARRVGWDRMKVQRRMTGGAELTVAELEQIARALDVPVTRFLTDSAAGAA
jgi:transcriptional regulator with XRE-family HTH domain